MRILLVEDNSDHRELMCLALTEYDATWQVEGVVSGEEALCHLAEGEAYDVVFLDYSLPERDGLEVLEEIRRGEAPPPVVMVTGRGDERVAVKAMKGGAYDYVVKGEGYLQRLPVVAQRAVEAQQLAVERKKAEETLRHQNEMLRTILDSIPVMVALLDREGHHQLVNRCWQSTLGWSLEKAQHQDVLAEIYPDPAYRKYVMDYIAAAAGTWSDFKTRTRDGRVLDTSWVNVPLSDGSNIGIGIDITERKQAEEKVRASLTEKEILLQEIHHRVKNNLQLISSLLGLQSRYLEDEKSREILRESQNRVRVMANIHTMLYQSENLSRVDFGCFIRDLTGRLQQSYGITGSPIEVHVDMADLSLSIKTSIPCGLILNELVSNALKHAFPEGRGGEVNISMTKAGDRFVFKVQDNGIGFPKAVDFQNTQTLGLELVRILVEQIHGTIDLRVDGGTTFTITFPAVSKGG